MWLIVCLLVLAGIFLLLAYRNEVAIVNHFHQSFKQLADARLNLISKITDDILRLEVDVKVEMLLLEAEGQFVKPVFQNMLLSIKAKTSDMYNMTLLELQEIHVEMQDLENNLFKKGRN